MYVIAVIVVWALILSVLKYLGHTEKFDTFLLVGLGFGLGMLAMYIAVHIYTWK